MTSRFYLCVQLSQFCCVGPVQTGVQTSFGLQFLNMFDSLVSRSQQIVRGQANAPVSSTQLPDAVAQSPSRFQIREHFGEFGAIDAVAPGIRTSTRRILDRTARYGLSHHFSQITYLKIVPRTADVERLVVYKLSRGIEDSQESEANILDVDERSPRCTVTHDQYLAGCYRVSHEIGHDDVAAKTR